VLQLWLDRVDLSGVHVGTPERSMPGPCTTGTGQESQQLTRASVIMPAVVPLSRPGPYCTELRTGSFVAAETVKSSCQVHGKDRPGDRQPWSR